MSRVRLVLVITIILIAVAVGVYWMIVPKTPAKIRFDLPTSLEKGQTYRVPLMIDTSVTANAGEFYFKFPPDLLEVKEIKKDNSVFALWIKDSPTFSNDEGTIGIAGGLPTPGFKGKKILIATVVFQARASGNGEITLQDASRLLANDGTGSKIDAHFEKIIFRIE